MTQPSSWPEDDSWLVEESGFFPSDNLFDKAQFQAAYDAETTKTKRREALGRILNTGASRELAVATPDIAERLVEFEKRLANAGAITRYIRRQIALSLLAEPPVIRWSPVLLDGPPGVGKTYFARALAEVLDVPLTIINCASVTASFVLAGNSPSWSDSRPGKVLEALRDSRVANPIVLLDEVDKLHCDPRFDGYGPLYQLLEEDTARVFEDEHIGLPVNASHILWLATSNDLKLLPEPIRSRFETLSMFKPSKGEVGAIAQSIYDNLLDGNRGWRNTFAATLQLQVRNAISGLPPREIRRVLTIGMGNAAMSRPGCKKIRLRLTDIELPNYQHDSGIGFLAGTGIS